MNNYDYSKRFQHVTIDITSRQKLVRDIVLFYFLLLYQNTLSSLLPKKSDLFSSLCRWRFKGKLPASTQLWWGPHDR